MLRVVLFEGKVLLYGCLLEGEHLLLWHHLVGHRLGLGQLGEALDRLRGGLEALDGACWLFFERSLGYIQDLDHLVEVLAWLLVSLLAF